MSKLQFKRENSKYVAEGLFRFGEFLEKRFCLAGVVLVAFFTLEVFLNAVPVAGGADSSGYLNYGRSLSEGKFFTELRVPEGLSLESVDQTRLAPLGYRLSEDGNLEPTYPAGLPMAVAVIRWLGGAEWIFRAFFSGISLFTGMGAWRLCHWWKIEGAWRLLVVAGLVASPLFFLMAIMPMTDSLAMCLAIWVVVAAMESSKRVAWGLLLGAMIGYSVLARPTGVFCVFPAIAALVVERANWKAWVLMGLGGLPFFGFWVWSNIELYGAVVSTGYGNIGSLMKWENVGLSFANYWENGRYGLHWILLFAAPGSLFLRGFWRRRTIILTAWAAPVVGFYSFYYHTHETWWFLRFLLPAVPVAVLLGGFFASSITLNLKNGYAQRGAVFAAYMLTAWVVYAGYADKKKFGLYSSYSGEAKYVAACDWLNENASDDSLIMCMQVSGSVYYYTDLPLFRYDMAKDDEWYSIMASLLDHDFPVYAVLFPFEREHQRSPLLRGEGNWRELESPATRDVKIFQLVR